MPEGPLPLSADLLGNRREGPVHIRLCIEDVGGNAETVEPSLLDGLQDDAVPPRDGQADGHAVQACRDLERDHRSRVRSFRRTCDAHTRELAEAFIRSSPQCRLWRSTAAMLVAVMASIAAPSPATSGMLPTPTAQPFVAARRVCIAAERLDADRDVPNRLRAVDDAENSPCKARVLDGRDRRHRID